VIKVNWDVGWVTKKKMGVGAIAKDHEVVEVFTA
jgi:hypothetical protein